MIELGITKVKDDGGYTTDEYRVFWKEDGRYNEDKSYYTDSPDDAAGTLKMLAQDLGSMGSGFRISDAKMTSSLMNKYEPDWYFSFLRSM